MTLFFSRIHIDQTVFKAERRQGEVSKPASPTQGKTINPILTISVCPSPSGDKSELKDTGKALSFDKDKSYKYDEEKLRYT